MPLVVAMMFPLTRDIRQSQWQIETVAMVVVDGCWNPKAYDDGSNNDSSGHSNIKVNPSSNTMYKYRNKREERERESTSKFSLT